MPALLAVVAALVTTAHAAGMYDQPYALVQTGQTAETRKEARVAVTKIDGTSTRNARRSDPISPGKHVVTLHFESARGVFRPEYREVELDLKACTRYEVVARYEAKTGPDWEPIVYTEPIGECVRKFGTKPAG